MSAQAPKYFLRTLLPISKLSDTLVEVVFRRLAEKKSWNGGCHSAGDFARLVKAEFSTAGSQKQ
jgi:hypothetical protein